MLNITIQPDFPRLMRLRSDNVEVAPELDFIQGLADLYEMIGGPDKTVVEVGCWTGESTEIAAQCVGILICIDPFFVSPEHEPIFDSRLAPYHNVVKLKTLSTQAAAIFANRSLDAVYIDAMHDYENVKADIAAWRPKVKVGGWIAGHDYDDGEKHVGVVKAVDELLGKPEHRFQDSSWAFKVEHETVIGQTTKRE